MLHSEVVVEHLLGGRNFTTLGADYYYYKGKNQDAERRSKLPQTAGLRRDKSKTH